jgi:hypothetical protein
MEGRITMPPIMSGVQEHARQGKAEVIISDDGDDYVTPVATWNAG